MAALTDSLYAFSAATFDLLETNKVALGVVDVYYGDQVRVPHTPSVCVESDRKGRMLDGVPRMTENTLMAYVLVYSSPIQSTQMTRRESDQLAEAIEAVLHSDATLGGLVTHSIVTSIEMGNSNKGGTLLQASRLTFEGQSKTRLPQNL